MRGAVLRFMCALSCALAFHALLVSCAGWFGWLSPDATSLPELDLSSVDLSFSDEPDESAAPAAITPVAAVKPPPPPPPDPVRTEPPPMEIPAAPDAVPVPRRPDPRPTDLRPEPLEAPDADHPREMPQQQPVASSPAPLQARVEADRPPSPLRRIKPEYPKGARERREEGDVTLELDIGASGVVENVRVTASCGFTELEQAAVRAVKRARFAPARRGSTAVPATVMLTLTFRLKE